MATGLARLGHGAGWIGRVGDDPFGRFIHTALSGTGIDTHTSASTRTRPPASRSRSHAGGGDPEVVYFRKNSAGSRLAWDPALESYIGGARHLHVTGIPLALSDSTRDFAFRAVHVAREHGVTVSFDTNLRPVLWASTAGDDRRHPPDGPARRPGAPGVSEGQVLLGTKDPLEIGADLPRHGCLHCRGQGRRQRRDPDDPGRGVAPQEFSGQRRRHRRRR